MGTSRLNLLLKLIFFLGAIMINPFSIGYLFALDHRIDNPVFYYMLIIINILIVIIFLSLMINPNKTINHFKSNFKQYLFLIISIFLGAIVIEIILNGILKQPKSYYVENYEFNYSVNLNNLGYRDEEFYEGKKKYRIFLIGDSFAFGSGTEDDYTLDKLLEKKCNCEVYNLGVTGSGPLTYVEIAEEFKEYNPDLIIVSLYVDNDIIRTESLKSITKIITNLKLYNLLLDFFSKDKDCMYSWIKDYDVAYKDLFCQGKINPYLLPRSKVGDNQKYYDGLTERFVKDSITKNNLIKIRHLYPKTRVIFLINPSKYQISNEPFDELKKIGFIFNENKVVDRKLQDTIIDWFIKNNIEYIDVLPNMINTSNLYYHKLDDHYNKKGNIKVSELIYEKIKSSLTH